ncbi:MAG: HlyC/CorC family transporter [Oceanicaulis sp.]|nr:HlyC/CorC family transporter [Oceanicaulis sp.]
MTPSESGSSGAPAPAGDLFLNLREFHAKRVEDVMVPRADIIAVEIDTPLNELARLVTEAGHSRFPVYRESLDDPIGVVHIRDIISYLVRYADSGDEGAGGWAEARILPAVRRPLLYVPPSMRALDLLLRMQSRRMHMALVVDEFGGTDGLVTLEDLIEPIVGDIEDEHDETEAPSIRAKGADCWEADARAPIEELERVVGREIATEAEENDVDTLGGLIFRLAGRVPERGEVLSHPSGLEFEILDSDPRRIKRLRVRPAVKAAAAPPAALTPSLAADASPPDKP